MSITSARSVQIVFAGDVIARITANALDNIITPGEPSELKTLAIGNNAIPVPVGVGLVITGLTIIPPAGNTNVITLKGVNGDTGFPLHVTDPTSIGLDQTFTGLVLSVLVQVNNVRLVWS
jgi:hypothetical protein